MATGLPLLTYGLAEIGSHRQLHLGEGRRPDHRSAWCWSPRSCSTRCASRDPLLDLRLYRRPTFSSASFAMFCLGAALFGGMILLPLYWQGVRHESVVDTGLLTAPQGLGMALMMPLAGKLTDRFGGGPLALFGVIADDAGDDPVRADRRAHLDAVPVGRDVRARHGHRVRVHARDGGRVRRAGPLRARRRDAAAQRAPARRRLDRHRRARGRAAARARSAPTRSAAPASAYGTAFWAVGRADRAGDHPLRHPRARRARRPGAQKAAAGDRPRRSRRRWRRERRAPRGRLGAGATPS